MLERPAAARAGRRRARARGLRPALLRRGRQRRPAPRREPRWRPRAQSRARASPRSPRRRALAHPLVERRGALRWARGWPTSKRVGTGAFLGTPRSSSRRSRRRGSTIPRAARERRPKKRRFAGMLCGDWGAPSGGDRAGPVMHRRVARGIPPRCSAGSGWSRTASAASPRAPSRAFPRAAITPCSWPRCPRPSGARSCSITSPSGFASSDGTRFEIGGQERAGGGLEWPGAQHLVEFRLENGLPVWRYDMGSHHHREARAHAPSAEHGACDLSSAPRQAGATQAASRPPRPASRGLGARRARRALHDHRGRESPRCGDGRRYPPLRLKIYGRRANFALDGDRAQERPLSRGGGAGLCGRGRPVESRLLQPGPEHGDERDPRGVDRERGTSSRRSIPRTRRRRRANAASTSSRAPSPPRASG